MLLLRAYPLLCKITFLANGSVGELAPPAPLYMRARSLRANSIAHGSCVTVRGSEFDFLLSQLDTEVFITTYFRGPSVVDALALAAAPDAQSAKPRLPHCECRVSGLPHLAVLDQSGCLLVVRADTLDVVAVDYHVTFDAAAHYELALAGADGRTLIVLETPPESELTAQAESNTSKALNTSDDSLEPIKDVGSAVAEAPEQGELEIAPERVSEDKVLQSSITMRASTIAVLK